MALPPAGDSPTQRCDELMQSLIDGIRSRLAVLDDRGVVLGMNAAWESPGGGALAPSRIRIGESYLEFCEAVAGEPAPTARSVSETIRALLAGQEEGRVLEYTCEGDSGRNWFEVRVTAIRGRGPGRVLSSHQDITESRQALHQSEAANRALLDAIPDLLFCLDREGRIQWLRSS